VSESCFLQLVTQVSSCYKTRRFITIFKRGRQLSLPLSRCIHSRPSHHITYDPFQYYILCMAAVLASGSLALGLSTKTCTHFLPSPLYHMPRPCHLRLFYYSHNTWGKRRRIWLRHCAASKKVVGSVPDGVTGIFIDLILPAALGVDTACDRNEYQ